jgi:hypothetical protein
MGKKHYILIVLSLLIFFGCGEVIKPKDQTIEIVKIVLRDQIRVDEQQYNHKSSGYIENDIEESIYFEILSPINQYSDDNPQEGKLKIITDNQTIIVTILDQNNLEILVDYQTDHYQNSYTNYNTQTIYTTWEELGF